MNKRTIILSLLLGIWALGSTAQAAIVYSGLQDIVLAENASGQIAINVGGADDDFHIYDERGGFAIRHPSSGGGSYWTFRDPEASLVIGIDHNAPIEQDVEWSRIVSTRLIAAYDEENPRFGAGEFFNEPNKYMPLRILDNDDALYGWVRMSHSFADEQLVIHDWAWNSVPGEPILAGEVPEPRTVGLLAGIAALAAAGGRRALRKRSMHTA